MSVLLDLLTGLFVLVGACFSLLAAIGVLRFPDPISRLHAAAKAQTLGVLLVMLGVAFQTPAKEAVVLALVVVFQLITVPVLGQVMGRTAYRTGVVRRASLSPDELAERLADDAEAGAGRDRRD
ncbi:monovalent cation/H(+) antiporter subunit G [Streptomyces avicenniae]|uniref:monovalent cation/H(+) antiporter subunit G n=1 Tax=Streptomyces avicenniae TaxID=500153 RepID=UPI00069B326F|nr:monovalent cation/H(+) antiporter subunit G [Streptomyces avicenniae]